MLITGEDPHVNRLTFGSHFRQCVCIFIKPSGNVDKLETVKLVFQLAHCLTIHGHLRAVAAQLLHHLIKDEMRISVDFQTSDAELDGSFERPTGKRRLGRARPPASSVIY